MESSQWRVNPYDLGLLDLESSNPGFSTPGTPLAARRLGTSLVSYVCNTTQPAGFYTIAFAPTGTSLAWIFTHPNIPALHPRFPYGTVVEPDVPV